MVPAATTETLWESLSDELKGFLRSRVSDEQAAEDLLQETFLRIHQKLGTVKDEQRLTSWVYQIARNLLTDHYRAQAKIATVPENDQLPTEPAEETAANLNQQAAGWLRHFIAQLPDGYRQAVELYEIEDLPQQDIADRLGLSLSGAKSRVQRGREKLKTLLLDCCTFQHDRRGNLLDCEHNQTDSETARCGEDCWPADC